MCADLDRTWESPLSISLDLGFCTTARRSQTVDCKGLGTLKTSISYLSTGYDV